MFAVRIDKARKLVRGKRTPAAEKEFRRQSSIAERMATPFKADLIEGVRTFRKDIDVDDLAYAVRTGKTDAVMQTIPWDKLDRRLAPVAQHLRDAAAASADSAAKALPREVSNDLRYDPRNRRIDAAVDTRIEALNITVQDGGKEAIRQALRRAMVQGLRPDRVAAEIRDSIGLNDRQAIALANFRQGLAQTGKHSDRVVDKMTAAYENRLLDQRAIMVARTEVRHLTNAAQQDVWASAATDGLIPDDARRQWIVDGRPCPELCWPMRNKTVALGQPWVLPDGRRIMVPTESHPHCECVEMLLMG